MIIIRDQQLKSLDAAQERAFVDRLVAEVYQHYSDSFGRLPDHAVRDLVMSGLERAQGFGFEWQSSLAAFVHLMFAIAPNFYRHPTIEAMLRDPAVPLEDRMGVLPSAVPPHIWEEVQEAYDVTAW